MSNQSCRSCECEIDPVMGFWVKFCHKHWFAIPQNLRMEMFANYRHADPTRYEFVQLVSRAVLSMEFWTEDKK